MVDLDCVIVFHHSSVHQLFMDLILPQRMLDVVILYLIGPRVVKRVDFASHFSAHVDVECFVYLWESTLA